MRTTTTKQMLFHIASFPEPIFTERSEATSPSGELFLLSKVAMPKFSGVPHALVERIGFGNRFYNKVDLRRIGHTNSNIAYDGDVSDMDEYTDIINSFKYSKKFGIYTPKSMGMNFDDERDPMICIDVVMNKHGQVFLTSLAEMLKIKYVPETLVTNSAGEQRLFGGIDVLDESKHQIEKGTFSFN